MNLKKTLIPALAAALTFFSLTPAQAASKKTYTVGTSIYVGWMPWYLMDHNGTLAKWGKANGIEIKVQPFTDYMASVTAFTTGDLDALTVTNMETLDGPSASGIDTSVIIVGDYSNGNDAILTRNKLGVKDLKGKKVYLVQDSVSQYLFSRCLEKSQLTEHDVTLVNTPDSQIEATFTTNKEMEATVTWNPIVMNIAQLPGVTKACTSAEIPGEILDLLVVRTETCQKSPEFCKAVAGAWYETMNLMTSRTPAKNEAIAYMAKQSPCTPAEYNAQLSTTMMFWKPGDAAAYAKSAELKERMEFVRQFCFDHKLLGEVKSANDIGIEYPDGSVQGGKTNIRMRFNTTYMDMAAAGTLTDK